MMGHESLYSFKIRSQVDLKKERGFAGMGSGEISNWAGFCIFRAEFVFALKQSSLSSQRLGQG